MFKTNNRCVEPNMPMNMHQGMNMNQPMNMEMMNMPGMECAAVMEAPCERITHREINHHVPHIQPINTKIVNHHVYHHSYTPQYTCCEENQEVHVYDQNECCNR